MKAIVVDIETHAFKAEVKRMRLLQLAWQLFREDGSLINEANFYVRPDGWWVFDKAKGYHGVDTKTAEQKGMPLKAVLSTFVDDLMLADVWVGHGFDLIDLPVLTEELTEFGFEKAVKKMHGGMHMFDTMVWCTDLMQLPRRDGVAGFKHPRLGELFEWLCYPNKMVNAHDALADVQATSKCYWRLCQLAEQVNLVSSAPAPTSKDERPLGP